VRLSVVVPTTNGAPTLDRCLDAIRAAMQSDDELIVVDSPSGGPPAQRRNEGASRASGDVLVFVDSDVLPHPTALDRIRAAFVENPALDAVFGCYDDTPGDPRAVSTFRNLLHHHVHRQNEGPACTFWSGLGGIRRETFLATGGFDAERYPRPMIEDIELGMRIVDAGGHIELHGNILGTHLKVWTLATMVQSDLLHRGVPWTRLILERGNAPATLNLAWRHRFSALAFLGLSALPLAALRVGTRRGVEAASALLLVAMALNHRFYALLLERGGPNLWIAGVLLHGTHHLVGATSIPVGMAAHFRAASGVRADQEYRPPPGTGGALNAYEQVA
jgi:GT2 family glycosyltransferase